MGGWALSAWISQRASIQALRVAAQTDLLSRLGFELLEAVPHTGEYLLPIPPQQLGSQLNSDIEALKRFRTKLSAQVATLHRASGDPSLHRDLEAIRVLSQEVQRNLERTAVEVQAAGHQKQPLAANVLQQTISDPSIEAIRKRGDALATIHHNLDHRLKALKSEERSVPILGFAIWLTGLLLGWVVGLCFAWRTADRILNPLLRLEQLMETPGQNVEAELQSPTFIKAPKEIANLSGSFHRLMREGEALTGLLRAQASTDGLTSVGNRRRFDEGLTLEWNRGIRSGQPLSLLLLDVDHFKLYNDVYGHVQGDTCLQTIADVIRNQARRSSDLVCRIGGEEFAVLLPETTLTEAKQVAGGILSALDARALDHSSSPVAPWVTASIGIACTTPNKANSPSRLIQQADRALYARKRNHGRHGVTIADPLS